MESYPSADDIKRFGPTAMCGQCNEMLWPASSHKCDVCGIPNHAICGECIDGNISISRCKSFDACQCRVRERDACMQHATEDDDGDLLIFQTTMIPMTTMMQRKLKRLRNMLP